MLKEEGFHLSEETMHSLRYVRINERAGGASA